MAITNRDILDRQWAALFQRVDPQTEDAIRQMLTSERLQVCRDEQVKAIGWVASELGAATTIGKAVTALGELIEKGHVKL